jgi:hypothetical protein
MKSLFLYMRWEMKNAQHSFPCVVQVLRSMFFTKERDLSGVVAYKASTRGKIR